MAENKTRDDTFINKKQDYEVKFILDQYPQEYHDIIRMEIKKKTYQSHDDLYARLSQMGIERNN
jgi:hypothetical protein